ncbi:MAG: DUF6660 family protein [Chitinophagaceae bacterium]
MKLFSIILSLIMMGLSNVPCGDRGGDTCPEPGMGAYSSGGGETHSDHEDLCSPFCQCNCCAGYSIHYETVAEAEIFLPGKNKFISFLPEKISEVSLPVWQPPQILS